MFNVVRDSLTVTWRGLLRYVRIPQLLVFSTIQPVMILLLFNYVFGGAIQTNGGEYINFLLPGVLVQTVLFGSTNTGIGITEDMSSGIVDRFKSLPMARSAFLNGRVFADTIRNLIVICIMTVVGLLLGFDFTEGWLKAIAAILLVTAFGSVFSWISVCIGLAVKDTESAQAAGFIWIFPLVFASGIFVPTETMPSWLQKFADNQPVTRVAETVRYLTTGFPGGEDSIVPALLWIAGIGAVFSALAAWLYRRS